MRLLLLFIFLPCVVASAQSKKQGKEEEPTESFYPQAEQTPKNSKKKSNKASYDAREQSFDRLERNWKRREKKEKKLSNKLDRDYTMAPYFGHRKPPKIRPVGKRKVCKVCGLTH